MRNMGYCKHGNTGICMQCMMEGDKAEHINLGYCKHGKRSGEICFACMGVGSTRIQPRELGHCKHGNTGICMQCMMEGDKAEHINLGYCKHGKRSGEICFACMNENPLK